MKNIKEPTNFVLLCPSVSRCCHLSHSPRRVLLYANNREVSVKLTQSVHEPEGTPIAGIRIQTYIYVLSRTPVVVSINTRSLLSPSHSILAIE